MLIETPRLLIRCKKLTDLSDSFEHRGCTQVSEFISEPLTLEQTKTRLTQAIAPWGGEENEKLM